jgi:hypothetical protein
MASRIEIQGLGKLDMSPKARKYIDKKIKILIRDEGYPQKQAVAAAFSMARRRGYKVPRGIVAR